MSGVKVFLGYNFFMLRKMLGAKWWITGVLFCAIGVPFMAYQKHRATEKYRNHRAEFCAAFMTTAEQEKACEEEKANANDYLGWGYVLFEWPDGVTAWAIIATGFAVAWQAWEARKAGDSASKAANAALLNAQAYINSERPWVFAEVTTPTDVAGITSIYDISCVNRGKTPARILDCRTGHRFVDDLDSLLLSATDYHPTVMPFPTLKATDSGFRAARVHPGVMLQGNPGYNFVMFFGYVTYDDVFPTEGSHRHETYWCFAWTPHLVSGLTPSGPNEYTKNT